MTCLRFVLTCFIAVLLCTPSAADIRPLQYDDVFLLEAVREPAPSPDGERIVFVRNWMDRQRDRSRHALWIVDADGSGLQPLTARDMDARAPRWSEDGERLAFVADGQIHVLWLDTGRSSRISALEHGVSELAWSPDGRWLAFVAFMPAERKPPVELPGRPEDADWAEPPIWIEQPVYRRDGAGYLREGSSHVYLIPAEGGAAIRLTSGDFDHEGISWHPDGTALYLSANRRADAHREPLRSAIYRLEVETRELVEVVSGEGPHTRPRVSPDGRLLAWLGFEDEELSYQANRVFVMNLDGDDARNLTEDLDRHIDEFQWQADSRGLVIQYDHKGRALLARQPLRGERQVLTDRLGGEYFSRPYSSGQFAVARSGLIAHTHADTTRPAELAVIDRRDSRVITDLNRDLARKRDVGEVEEFWYTSSVDGRDLQGWVIHPPGFDPEKRYPLILEIHGGPFATYGPFFTMELQLMAARGYVVVYLNPRGSTSYGEAFANEIHHNYPSHDFDDLMDGVDTVVARGYIDPDELFITGGSGGGALTTWAVAHTNRFAAAAAVNPVINWYSFTLNADMYHYFTRYWFPGPPWEHAEHYLAYSPISHVGKVNTPTLLFTGEEDYRTPIAESEQYYQALQLRGIESALVRVPGASHSLDARPSNLMAKPAYIIAWFERFRAGDEGP